MFTRIKNKIQKFGWRKICEKWSSYIWMSLSRISASGSICLCLLVLRFISISRKSRKTKSFSNVNMEINIRFFSVSRPQKETCFRMVLSHRRQKTMLGMWPKMITGFAYGYESRCVYLSMLSLSFKGQKTTTTTRH